jgi:protein-S-isoprenylcysteine O-methyltransferase Ste14
MISKIPNFFKNNRHTILNIYLALNISGWIGWHLYKHNNAGTLDFVEVSFAIHNLVILAVILFRRAHKTFNKNIFNQSIAAFAFFSGLAFMGQPASGDPILISVSKYVVFAANIIGIITLINLGRSFGILIACREIKTGGLYSIVRHPMYFTDILLRVGFLISHFNWFTSSMFIVSVAAYAYRAILEERFLIQQQEYQLYKEKVKYRFIPYIF